ncbi:MAG TPA: PIN domain-containing protein [Candidatus Hydrogenedentes bacterium]|nr:PIN domain-containing protein [Candidatus Hydrogenedentota bacterium]
MIAVDTNLLVYAHRKDSPWYNAAASCITKLAEGRAAWTIPWPCIHEFLAVVTHPNVFKPPSSIKQAISQIDTWMESPSLLFLTESKDYWSYIRTVIQAGRIVGPMVHDAHVAALCLQHEVTQLWTTDRDFSRFPGICIYNPLVVPDN